MAINFHKKIPSTYLIDFQIFPMDFPMDFQIFHGFPMDFPKIPPGWEFPTYGRSSSCPTRRCRCMPLGPSLGYGEDEEILGR